MNDQAKRWTARGTFIARGDRDVAEVINRYTGEAPEIATRLAACADLLRGWDDLEAVAVMKPTEEMRTALCVAIMAFSGGVPYRQIVARTIEHNCAGCGQCIGEECLPDCTRQRNYNTLTQLQSLLEILPKPARSETKGG